MLGEREVRRLLLGQEVEVTRGTVGGEVLHILLRTNPREVSVVDGRGWRFLKQVRRALLGRQR